jgi:hypothetical protein
MAGGGNTQPLYGGVPMGSDGQHPMGSMGQGVPLKNSELFNPKDWPAGEFEFLVVLLGSFGFA